MSKRIVLILITLGFILLSSCITTHAATITGETSLGGMSKVLDDFYSSGNELYTQADLNLLSEVMYHENYCNGDECMLLTGSVVINRTQTEWYPDTIEGVLYQKGQYATTGKFFTVKIPEQVRELAKQLLIFGSIAPKEVVFQAMFPQGRTVYKVIRGEYFCIP